MFRGLLERLRVEIGVIKNAVDIHEHARTSFFSGSVGDELDCWALVRSKSPNRLDWQIYDHCAAFTRLYAVYERFIEDLIAEYLELIPTLYPSYNELPEPILRQHRLGCGQILLKLGSEGPYRHLREEEIVARLSDGLAGRANYRLINDAFFVERQNYRADSISRLCSFVGIEDVSTRIAKSSGMKKFLRENLGDTVTFQSELQTFVRRRNEAAHGDVGEVVGSDDFKVVADFISLICEILAEFVTSQVLARRLIRGECTEVGEIIETYCHGSVVVVRAKSGLVKVGDALMVKQNDRLRSISVSSIQIDGSSVDHVQARSGQELGLKVSQPCRVGTTIYTLLTDGQVGNQEELFTDEELSETATETTLDGLIYEVADPAPDEITRRLIDAEIEGIGSLSDASLGDE
jgi:hypothetical protein